MKGALSLPGSAHRSVLRRSHGFGGQVGRVRKVAWAESQSFTRSCAPQNIYTNRGQDFLSNTESLGEMAQYSRQFLKVANLGM